MTELPARYFDGQVTQCHPVRVRFEAEGAITLLGPTGERLYPSDRITVRGRLGNTPRIIELADGGRIEIDDNDGMEQAMAAIRGRRPRGGLHTLENRWGLILGSALLTLLLGWLLVAYGIPAAADLAARHMPSDFEDAIANQTVTTMDRGFFSPSELDDARQQRVRELFKTITDTQPQPDRYRLLFRKSKLFGANAMALPDGVVVITDDLVNLAESDAEILGVLAHEVGHVVGRHSLRQVLQNGATTLMIGVIVGDISTASTLAAALPTLFIDARYSRAFEREADRFAARWMRQNHLDPAALGDLLTRMSEGESGPGWLSSHPPTPERAELLATP